MGKPGRPVKYNAKKFRKAVEKYFRGISVEVEVPDVLNLDGEPIKKIAYAEPPTISSLCLALGIDRSTWENYSNPDMHPDTAKTCEGVKLRIEAYLERELLTREKSVQGIIFNLSNNYGWSEKHEHSQRVELGEETRKVVSQNLTLDEKFALIREAAAEIAEAPETSHEDDGTEE